MPDIRNRPMVPTNHINEKEHRRLLADQANAGIPVLRDFTPVLKFGGASTGITYSSAIGRAVTHAGVVHEVWIDMTLTSKGSATGVATVHGILEYNRSGADSCSGDFSIENGSGNLNGLKAEIDSGDDFISLYHSHGSSAGLATAIDEDDLTNTSIIHIHISYRIV